MKPFRFDVPLNCTDYSDAAERRRQFSMEATKSGVQFLYALTVIGVDESIATDGFNETLRIAAAILQASTCAVMPPDVVDVVEGMLEKLSSSQETMKIFSHEFIFNPSLWHKECDDVKLGFFRIILRIIKVNFSPAAIVMILGQCHTIGEGPCSIFIQNQLHEGPANTVTHLHVVCGACFFRSNIRCVRMVMQLVQSGFAKPQ